MPDALLARYPDGLQPPVRLELSGENPWVLKSNNERAHFEFERFAVDWLDADGAVLLHFSPRPDARTIVLNSFLDGRWGEEEVVEDYPFPLEPDVPFILRFDVRERRFRVAVDNRVVCEFRHRAPPEKIVEVRSNAFLWRLESSPLSRLRRRRGDAFSPGAAASRNRTPRTWVTAEPNASEPDRLGSFRFFAALCTWMEEDIIAATIANARHQGCERVYVIDNGSPDRTVERALAAGATLAGTFDEGYFGDDQKTRRLQELVDDVSAREDADHIWWLFLDADEFYHGPRGLTLHEYRRFRVVGARFFNHLPTAEPAYVEGRHPLDFQPLCYEIIAPYCEQAHWRHSLQRWDREGARVAVTSGFHMAKSSDFLLEPSIPVFFHHFPFRAEQVTRSRLLRLFGRNGGADNRIRTRGVGPHMRVRLRALDAVYEQHWERMAFYPPCAPGYVPRLRPWDEWVERADGEVPRWY